MEEKQVIIATSLYPRDVENQQLAIASWQSTGFKVISFNAADEIAELAGTFKDIEFITVKRDARSLYGKPCVYLDDILTYFKRQTSIGICGIVNSDIHFLSQGLYDFVQKEAPGSLLFGARTEVSSLLELQGKKFNGFDVFFFDRSVLGCYPQTELCLGQPWWDAWMPLMPILRGIPAKEIAGDFAYHIKHDRNYSVETWVELGLKMFHYFACGFAAKSSNVGKLEGYIRYLTNKYAPKVWLNIHKSENSGKLKTPHLRYDELAYELHRLGRQSKGQFTAEAMVKNLEKLFQGFGFRDQAIDVAKAKNILVLRLDEIGDSVLNTALLRNLRHNYPDASITLIVKPEVRNLMELCPYINELLTWSGQTGRGQYFFGSIIEFCQTFLWDKKYDLCINPRYDHDSSYATLLGYLSGARARVGYTENATSLKKSYNAGYDKLLTHVFGSEGSVKHEVERNQDILRFLDCQVSNSKLELWTSPDDEAYANEQVAGVSQILAAVAPGTGNGRRSWPIDRYIEFIQWFSETYGGKVMLLGSKVDEISCQKIAETVPGAVLNFAGKTTLRQTAALLKKCQFYVGRDTGIMHMAAAVGKAVVEISCHPVAGSDGAVFSPVRFAPWGVFTTVLRPEKAVQPCREECTFNEPHCILQVTTEQVKQAVASLMSLLSSKTAVAAALPHSQVHKERGLNYLFIHPNFPAQFLNIAPALAKNAQNKVVYLTNRREGRMPGVTKAYYQKVREPAKETHGYLQSVEDAVLQAQAAFHTAQRLKTQGFLPDIIIGHSGWGPTINMKDIFPHAALVGYFEWFYHAHGTDVDFDPSEPLTLDTQCRIRIKNMPILADLYSCDYGICPTHYQHSQFPVEFREKIKVLHDGVDTDYYQPKPGAKLVLPQVDLDLSDVEELVTYVGRGMEPYRGFPQFMESVEILLKQRPKCHVVIVGADRVAYGRPAPGGKSYKELMLEKLSIDLTRVHFTGLLPPNMYRQVLQASSAHIYLTRPFVLSWSMLEAMSAGCLLVASDTAPVREVVEHGSNGLLVDFFSPQQIADTVTEALTQPEQMAAIRARARETILEKYALKKLLPQKIALLKEIAHGK